MSVYKISKIILAVLLISSFGLSGCAMTDIASSNSKSDCIIIQSDNEGTTNNGLSSIHEDDSSVTTVSSIAEVAHSNDLSIEEQSIANALLHILQGWIDGDNPECPEINTFKDAIVRVSYMSDYEWYGFNGPDTWLLEIAPEGITCYVEIPLSLENQAKTYAILLGRSPEGTFYYDHYNDYPLYRSVGEIIENLMSVYVLPPDSIRTFEFRMPSRAEYDAMLEQTEGTLNEAELEQVKTIRAFMPDELWHKLEDYNIRYGRQIVGEGVSFTELEPDNELRTIRGVYYRYYKLDDTYSISVDTYFDRVSDNVCYLYINGIKLHNKVDDTGEYIPRKLFPFAIALGKQG